MTRKTEKNVKTVAVELDEVKHTLVELKGFLVPLVQQVVQLVLELEMEDCLRVCRPLLGERSDFDLNAFAAPDGIAGPHLPNEVDELAIRGGFWISST